ncbi:MAG: MBL fold metallo-hydrolase, partial [Prevotella sp.]|nr:MBL fold metallo-hydrolase [Prevotella sp.]
VITDNQDITFGNHKLKVIPTPGHSKGSVTFYCKEENVAFTGDTLFQQSIGRTDLHGGSMMQIIQSLRILAQLPDETVVKPGHGNDTTIGRELESNPFMER